MSSTSVQQLDLAPRRHLSARQSQTLDRLVQAAVEEVAATGYSSLTVRNVAKRAGVASGTAYTYFASKEHLVSEVYLRRFTAQAEPAFDPNRSPAERATDALLAFALTVSDETELAAAVTVAMLADNPEVRDLRVQIGLEVRRRLTNALGDDVDPIAVRTLELATAGALLQVGTGHLAYGDVAPILRETADLVLGETRR
ncbi:MAG: TetR/AcrR family transcriptional regulator [Acidimicrobiales bacterium]|nr:TetR/AcrR family transcriptional regulator [Acidimicrobiales bacterium]